MTVSVRVEPLAGVEVSATRIDLAVGGSVSITGGPGGATVHNDLTGRTADDAHPISAITGLQDALDAAGGGGGSVVAATAATNLSGHRCVFVDIDGTVDYAGADDIATQGRVVGITTGAVSSGGQAQVLIEGPIIEPSWSWSQGPIYVGAGGALTQAMPSYPSAAYAQIIGQSTGPTSMFVDIQPPITLT